MVTYQLHVVPVVSIWIAGHTILLIINDSGTVAHNNPTSGTFKREWYNMLAKLWRLPSRCGNLANNIKTHVWRE